jgi:hypothetical protein
VTGTVPSKSTFRRTLQRLDGGAFDDLAGELAVGRVIAVDCMTLRGSGHGSDGSRHLLAAMDHARGAVPGQVEVSAKTNEIPLFSALLDRSVAGHGGDLLMSCRVGWDLRNEASVVRDDQPARDCGEWESPQAREPDL